MAENTSVYLVESGLSIVSEDLCICVKLLSYHANNLNSKVNNGTGKCNVRLSLSLLSAVRLEDRHDW